MNEIIIIEVILMIVILMNMIMIVVYVNIVVMLGLGGGVFGFIGSVYLIVLLFYIFCFMKL